MFKIIKNFVCKYRHKQEWYKIYTRTELFNIVLIGYECPICKNKWLINKNKVKLVNSFLGK